MMRLEWLAEQTWMTSCGCGLGLLRLTRMLRGQLRWALRQDCRYQCASCASHPSHAQAPMVQLLHSLPLSQQLAARQGRPGRCALVRALTW